MLKTAIGSKLIVLREKVQLPNRFKGTIIERWASYWKNMYIDYKQMLQDLRTDIQDNPQKAMRWTVGLATTYALAKNNPDELEFRDFLKTIGNEIVMVSEECRNAKATEHLHFIETSYNRGLVRYANLGIASIIYTVDDTKGCDLYKAHCSYLQPSYFDMLSRIVDIGIMGRWWNIYIKTTNYDVQ